MLQPSFSYEDELVKCVAVDLPQNFRSASKGSEGISRRVRWTEPVRVAQNREGVIGSRTEARSSARSPQVIAWRAAAIVDALASESMSFVSSGVPKSAMIH